MASLRKTKGGSYIACFRLNGRQYQRALKTKDGDAADAAMGLIVNRLYRLSNGDLSVPPGADPGDFIVWGEAAVPEADVVEDDTNGNAAMPSVEALVERYLQDQKGLKAESTLTTERIHLGHLKSYLGPRSALSMDQIMADDLDAFLQQREGEVAEVTVLKERQTVKQLFDWAVRKTSLKVSPAIDLRRVQAGQDPDDFRTREEIEEILNRGGLSDNEVLALWKSLYLLPEEIAEILALVRDRAEHDFVYPMFCIPAYAGMRRSEIVRRLRWPDIDYQGKSITARSQKQSRQKKMTSRKIALHPDLERILREYQQKRPKGQHVICFADTLAPLSPHQAHIHFQQPLRGTRWEKELPSGKKKIVIGFHTLRHSFASNLAIKGVDQRIIDRWMGHQTEEMRKRYQHLFPKQVWKNIRKLSFEP